MPDAVETAESPENKNEHLRIGVVVPTKGRSESVAELLKCLQYQTLLPTIVVFSATGPSDIGMHGDLCREKNVQPFNVKVAFGAPGSSMQRNRGIDLIINDVDLIAFIDDDIALSKDWLEQMSRLFVSDREIVGASGNILRDGSIVGPMTWQEAHDILAEKENSPSSLKEAVVISSTAGGHSVFRSEALRENRFDERLALYGWLEDKDLSMRVGRKGRLIGCNRAVGVHLGLTRGKVSGTKYGYSQIVNPWYLKTKGVLSTTQSLRFIAQALAANLYKVVSTNDKIDYRGRFYGNLLGVAELVSGQCRPERVIYV